MKTKKDVSFKAFLKWIYNWFSINPIETYGFTIFLISIALILLQNFLFLIPIPSLFLYWFYLMWKEEQLEKQS